MQNEKLSTLGLLAGSIAHEVKNPLSSIKTITTVLAEELGPTSTHAEDLRLVLGEVDRLANTTNQLLEFARPSGNGQSCGSLNNALTSTLRIMRHLARQRGVTLEAQLPDNLRPVRADDHALREIFFNLLTNSIEAAESGGAVTIECHMENGRLVTEVRDNGPGISPEIQDRIFEPFVTTKPSGTGLGLYVVGRRIQELGGEIRCESAPGRGTLFTVKLPCKDS